MADEGQRPIVIKKIKKGGGGHHGGAWKIAYADFVTAMMAFFLLMWLLGSTSKGDLNGISEYFQNPLKVGMAGGSGSGDSSSVIKGGGKDLTRQDGQMSRASTEESKTYNLDAARRQLEKVDTERLLGLKSKIETLIEASPKLNPYKKQFLIDITSEGLRIQIVDEQNRPMFALAQAELQPYTREILREIGRVLNEVPNRLSLAGHTDANPYANGEKGYSNWELSADRANASRRELIAGGMSEVKVLRVVGLSSAVPLDKADPLNPANRRISIVVMNRKTEAAVSTDGKSVEVNNGATDKPDVQSVLTTKLGAGAGP